MGNPLEKGTERLPESEGMEDTRRTWSTESTEQGTDGLIDAEAASSGPEWFCAKSVVHV